MQIPISLVQNLYICTWIDTELAMRLLFFEGKLIIMVRFLNVALAIGVSGGAVVAFKRFKESRKKLPGDKHVVVVGAGYAGLTLADKMHGKANYTLVDSRDAMHHNLGALRACVEPGFAVKTSLPLKPKYGDHFVQGKVKSIDIENQSVYLEDSTDPIHYTHLVLATGSNGPFPGKCDINTSSDLLRKYEDYAQTIRKAQKIVIIGGGAVGVELAAEIAKEYPAKSVTIVHDRKTLVTDKLSQKALNKISKGLTDLGVKVVVGDTVKNLCDLPKNQLTEGLVVTTNDGLELEADLVIPCVGLRVNSEAYATSIPDKVNKRGQLMVDEFLRVKGLDNVYAIGDCNDFPVVKLALQGQFQAGYLWDSLSSGSNTKPYDFKMFMMALPLGRDGGVLQAGNWVAGNFPAKCVKAKDVLVSKVWPYVGLPVPDNTTPKEE